MKKKIPEPLQTFSLFVFLLPCILLINCMMSIYEFSIFFKNNIKVETLIEYGSLNEARSVYSNRDTQPQDSYINIIPE
ncbi:hypothetical protein BDB00DRAFT_860705 [Zychaea mexicana]|uniref:uncharacterized protein n=1 Tax=Zychaea mexicana TaxID=64656 RepID=UPI0022FEAC8D|nr:uncharacterized protein BDB00DRAFT_860705 [Zychaea mexicana]KAI9473373.1 hypothetical protein BDB00DRAFT_860705 [Zychaea mexicana]